MEFTHQFLDAGPSGLMRPATQRFTAASKASEAANWLLALENSEKARQNAA